jgi:hypothetical protein
MHLGVLAALGIGAVLLVGCGSPTGIDITTSTPSTSTKSTFSVATAPPSTAPPPVPTQTYTGQGNDVVTLATPVEVGIMTFECPKCSGSTTVKSDAGIDEDLVNRFSGGAYSGTRWLGMRGGTTSRLQVNAKGSWTLTVGGLDLVRQYEPTEAVIGSGDDVVLYRATPPTAALTHKGRSNFSVQVMTDGLTSPDLAVNEIGQYDGTVLFPATGSQAGLVQITADGAWTMTPKS